MTTASQRETVKRDEVADKSLIQTVNGQHEQGGQVSNFRSVREPNLPPPLVSSSLQETIDVKIMEDLESDFLREELKTGLDTEMAERFAQWKRAKDRCVQGDNEMPKSPEGANALPNPVDSDSQGHNNAWGYGIPVGPEDWEDAAVNEFLDDIKNALNRLERSHTRALERFEAGFIRVEQLLSNVGESNNQYLSAVAKARNALMHALIGNKVQKFQKKERKAKRDKPPTYNSQEYKTLHFYLLEERKEERSEVIQDEIYAWMEFRAQCQDVIELARAWPYSADRFPEYVKLLEHLKISTGISFELEESEGDYEYKGDSDVEEHFNTPHTSRDVLDEFDDALTANQESGSALVPFQRLEAPIPLPQIMAPSYRPKGNPPTPEDRDDSLRKHVRKASQTLVSDVKVPIPRIPDALDVQRTLDPYDGKSGWTVCRWPLWDGTSKLQHSFIDDHTVHFQSTFRSDDKKYNVNAHGNYPVWGGLARPFQSEGKGTFIYIVGTNAKCVYHEGNLVVTFRDRLRTALMSTLYRHTFSGLPEKERMINMARNHYLRWNAPRPDLEEELLVEYESDWFQAELDAAGEAVTNGWLQRARRQARAYCGARGRDYDQEFYDWRSNPLTRFMRRVSSFFSSGRYLGESEEQFLRQFPMEKVQLGLIPCSKAWIAKQSFPADRELPPITNEANVLRIHRVTESVEEKVESFGLLGRVPMTYPLNDQSNLVAALRIRMLGTPEPQFQEAVGYMHYAMAQIDGMEHVYLDDTFDNLAYLQAKYGEKKGRRLYELAEEDITADTLTTELFVKGEAYRGKDKNTYKPRQICNNKEKLVAHFSGYTHQIGNHLCQEMNSDDDHMYLSKSTPQAVGDRYMWQLLRRQHTKEFDGSNYDGSLTIVDRFLELYYVTTKVHGMPRSWDMVLKNWYGVKGRSKDGLVELLLEAARESGWLLTGPFNTLTNRWKICYALNSLGAENLLTMLQGDDGIVSYDGEVDDSDIEDMYLRLGMKLVVETRSPGYHTMCSGRMYPVNGKRKWGGSAFKLLSTLGLNHHNHGPHLYRSLLVGTAKSLLPVAGHIPIIGLLLRIITTQAELYGIKPRYDNRHLYPDRIQGGLVDYPDDDTYQFFAEVYGLEVNTILSIEEGLAAQFDLLNCPYSINAEWFTTGYGVDVGTSGEDLDNLGFEARETIGFTEERDKLAGVTTFAGAIESGYQWGLSEDQSVAPDRRVNCYLHAFFSALSYIHFSAGVAAHNNYNRYVMERLRENPNCGLLLATKAKKRKPKNAQRVSRRVPGIPRVRGRGGYFSDAVAVGKRAAKAVYDEAKRSIPKGAFGDFGERVGGTFGPLAASLGRHAGNMISNLTGMGGYAEIRRNTLLRPVDMGEVIATFGSGRDYVRIRHREYIGDVLATGGTAFTVTSFAVNPGLPVTAPWGAGVCSNFDQYMYVGLAAEFISLFSDITAGGPLGGVALGSDYNDLNASFGSKTVMENAQFSVSGKPSKSLIHYFECDPAMTQSPIKNVRCAPVSGDLRLYDLCNFQVATFGLPVSTGVLGELWMTYDVILFKPTLSNSIGTVMDHFQLPTSISSAHYLGADTTTTYNPVASSTLGGTVKSSTYTFPTTVRIGDVYEVKYNVFGASTALTNAIAFILVGCTSYSLYNNDTGPAFFVAAGVTHTLQFISYFVKLTSTTPSIGITSGTLPGTITNGDWFVTKMSVST